MAKKVVFFAGKIEKQGGLTQRFAKRNVQVREGVLKAVDMFCRSG